MHEATVKKDGPNKGRRFFGCDDRDCRGFVWGVGSGGLTPISKPVEAPTKTSQEVWDRKDKWQAKMSAWKSASSVYEGTGKEVEVTKLARVIYESITKEDMNDGPFPDQEISPEDITNLGF